MRKQLKEINMKVKMLTAKQAYDQYDDLSDLMVNIKGVTYHVVGMSPRRIRKHLFLREVGKENEPSIRTNVMNSQILTAFIEDKE